MTRERLVTDEQLGELARKQHDLFRRVRDGSLPFDPVMAATQAIIEGRFVTLATTNYEEYTFEFDGDDPRWNTIDQKKYAWVGDITASDYPRTIKGKYRATVVLLPFDRNWSNRQGLQRIDDEHLLHMQRPIIETFGEKFPQVQQKAPVIGICGRPVRHRGELCVPHVSLREDGVDLGWRHVEGGWVRDCRLLAVRSIVAL